ncbi:V-type proton ATPase subunit G 3-like [Acipenser ruthenus]|uniref:V-type proton ATPase subunit G 3-like n=1 Tax=Acipenser ruthenus TaxID=7906 RepID=UPI00145A13C5|nr:V-type proton ATPase subunit G 3-like [Acipenser ruthenus]
MTSQSHGIHHLIQAEKKAKEKLDEAKKHKYNDLNYPLIYRMRNKETQTITEHLHPDRNNDDASASATTSDGDEAIPITGVSDALSDPALWPTLTPKIRDLLVTNSPPKIQTINSDFNQNKESVLKQLIDLACGIKAEILSRIKIIVLCIKL